MKTLYRFALLLAFGLTVVGCKKAAYLTDDGLHTAEVNLSTYDYLAAHPNGMFDTLLMVIDHFKLKEEMNKAKTFWAPSDYSVNRYYKQKADSVKYVDENAQYSFEQFLDDIPIDSVRAYMYNDAAYNLETATTAYKTINNAANLSGFVYHMQRQPKAAWSSQPVYYLYYVKVRGEADQISPDGIVTVKEEDQADMRVYCQTTGIKTASGTLLNVLANTHTFIGDFVPRIITGPKIVEAGSTLTFTYDLSIKYDATGYTGTTVDLMLPRLARFYGLESGAISGLVGRDITYYAVQPDGNLNANSTANAPGHWFDAKGQTCSWGTDARIVSELASSTMTFSILQYPGQTSVGSTYTVRQSLVYKSKTKGDLNAVFVFNIKIK
ncbi:DUF4859 domain-containing protein [Sphingobacterium sp.]|uniref:DUF4859 domain-containing protein n=1 Tax=Sphingobacterium sp. TaxID=341027 RepID=UPI00289BC572|nr:DUF4859 domain-containing protein [Sphingobacterium sp.]